MNDWIKVGVAAQLASVSHSTIRNWAKNGYIIKSKATHSSVYYSKKSIQNFIKKGINENAKLA